MLTKPPQTWQRGDGQIRVAGKWRGKDTYGRRGVGVEGRVDLSLPFLKLLN